MSDGFKPSLRESCPSLMDHYESPQISGEKALPSNVIQSLASLISTQYPSGSRSQSCFTPSTRLLKTFFFPCRSSNSILFFLRTSTNSSTDATLKQVCWFL